MATRLSDLELFGPENRPTAERRRASRSPSRNRLTDDELFGASEERETAGYRAPVRDPLDDYTDAEYIAQGALELAKGIPSGAARMYGTALQGAGALQEGMEATAANRGLNTDSLERLRPFHETIAAGGLDEQSAAQLIKDAQEQLNPVEASHVREAVEDALAGDEQAGEFIAPDRTLTTQSQIDNNPLIGAGRAVNTYADRILPAAPGFEESITRQLGEGLGSLFAAVPLSAAGGPITASTFFALAGSGEAVERALRAGASPDDVIAAGRAGILPGLTDSMPLEILMGRLPIPGGKFAGTLLKVGDDMIGKAMRAMGRIGTQAFVEGIQEGGQGFLQNLIAQEIYAPEQELLEGIGPDAALGAGVGGIAQAAKEIGAGLLQQFAGRRGAVTVTLPDGTTGVAQVPQGAREQASSAAVDLTPEDNASPLPNDLIARGKQIMGDAGASSDAGAILQEMGLPGPESRVTVTIGGRTVPGTIVDGFRVEVAEMGVNEPGVKIALDDGTVFEETTTGLQQRGVQIAAEAPAAPAGEVSAPAGVPGGPGAPSATPAAPAAQPPAPTGGGMLPGGAPVGDGTPSAPVVAQTPEDVDRAAGLVNTAPTDGQKEAGNYKHGHVRVAGLDIAIETPLGAERSGTDPNGQPWSVTMPAHYGRLKRTEGADGEQVDVYLGDNLQSQTVYIIDQGDADSGAFDEHKVMLGFSTEDEAVATYDAAFNDGRGPDRRQAITTMSLDEFRDWLSDGDTTSAVAGAGTEPSGNTVQLPGEAQETADQAPVNVPEQSGGAIRRNSAQYGTITTGPLVAPYGTTDQQRRILDRAAKKFDGAKVRQADGRWQLDLPRNASPETRTAAEAEIERQTNITVAKSERGRAQGGPKRGAMGLAEYIARNGGIVDVGGELTAADMQIWHQGKPGMPKVIISREQATEKGHAAAEKSPDEWLVRAKEQGYLPQDATLSDLFEAITTNQHKPDEAVADAARPDARADQEATDRSEDLHAEVKAASRRLDLLLGESEITAVMEIMAANPTMDAEEAIEYYVENADTEALDGARDETQDDDYDIPFGAPEDDAAVAGESSERPEGIRGDAEEGGAGGAPDAQDRGGEGEAGRVEPTTEATDTSGTRPVAQTVIPGAEQSAKQAAESRENEGKGRIKAKTPQKDADEGLFGGAPEAELFDAPAAPAAPPETGGDAGLSPAERARVDALLADPKMAAAVRFSIQMSDESAAENKAHQDRIAAAGVTEEEYQAVMRSYMMGKPSGLAPDREAAAKKAADEAFAARREVPDEDEARKAAGVTKKAQEQLSRARERGEITKAGMDYARGRLAGPASSPDVPAAAPASADKIEDFGAKIEGARKDYAAKMRDAADVDIADVPFSQSWPEPDYQKMLADGVDPWAVAFIHAARDEIPTKPRKGWKLKSWVAQVEVMRTFAIRLMDGTYTPEMVREKMAQMKGLTGVTDRIDLYQAVGHEKSLKGVRIRYGEYSMRNGERLDKPMGTWIIARDAKATAFSNWPQTLAEASTRAAAIADFKARYDSIDTQPAASKQVSFDIYAYKTGPKAGGFWIGKKIGRDHFDMQRFDTVAEARAYRAERAADLEAQLARYKDIPDERKASNSPRVGADHRGGADVSPQQFTEAFGFRGVQFGNYVEGARRQADLNEAYDALMDMAGVLGVPARALSLNGELGLAFGARGKGKRGKMTPAAHYEPGQIVINLTKNRGAGSLAHEWWHGLDNYFSRARGKPGAFLTESTNQPGEGVRPEVVAAFTDLMRTINQTSLRQRSSNLDKRRTEPYWSTGLEMSARSFESYIIEKLRDQDAANDYLANIVSEAYWEAEASLGLNDGAGNEASYPYPTAAEVPAIRAGFDALFGVLETRESVSDEATAERGGPDVALFSTRRAQTETPAFRRLASFVGPTAARDMVAGLDQSVVNGLERNAQAITDFLEGQPRTAQGDGIVDVPPSVLAHVVEVAENPQVLRSVVRALPVDVVDLFERQKIAPQDALRDQTVLEDVLSIDRQAAVALGVDVAASGSLLRAVALHAAEVARLARGALEVNAAGSTGANDAISSAHRRRSVTENDAFSKWFGESKVVDEAGEPLVVYHGTAADIAEFDRSATVDGGFHFGTSAQANMRTAGEGRNLVPAHLSIQNPRRSKDMGGNWKAKIASARAAGHDGIVYLNRYEGIPYEEFEAARSAGVDLDRASDAEFRRAVPSARDSYIAFEPSQIKSATGNRGTFDSADNRIAFQLNRGAVKPTAEFMRQAPEISRLLREELDALGLTDIDLVVQEFIKEVVDGTVESVDGVYMSGLIRIALDGQQIGFTLHHEAIHALKRMGAFKPAEWRALERAARADKRRWAEIQNRYDFLSEKEQIEEAIADMFGDWMGGRSQTGGFMRTAFERIRAVLEAIARLFRAQGMSDADAIFERVASGEVGRRPERRRNAKGQFAANPRDHIDAPGPMGISPAFAAAWHGTGHEGFDRFSLEFIGSGEGAAAYGWGLYFAGKEGVAKHYREALAKTHGAHNTFDGRRLTEAYVRQLAQSDEPAVAEVFGLWGQNLISKTDRTAFLDEKIEKAKRNAETYEARAADHRANPPIASTYKPEQYDEMAAQNRNLVERLSPVRERLAFVSERKGGALFKVNLAPAEDEYLLWDKPLSEQSEKVESALDDVLRALHPDPAAIEGFERDWNTKTGEDLYLSLANAFHGLGADINDFTARGDRDASLALHNAGIPGIKYLDGSSRNRPLREIKSEFLAELPEDADIEEVEAMIGTGQFSPQYDAVLAELRDNDWLGFDYPAQAISAAYSSDMANYDASPALVAAIEATKDGATYNYVIFDPDLVQIEARFSLRRPERPVLVRNASTPAPTFDNPESEARLKAAMKGVAGTDSLVARTRDWLDYQIIHGFSRHFIHLPNVPRFADLAQQLRKLQASPGASKERIVRMLREITKGMTPADLDLFTRKVILDDLAWEVEQEHDLPFAMSPEDVRRELSKVDAILADRPDLTHAVRTRKVMSRAIAEQLVQSGVLSREAVKNPAYYRHQVLEYANGIRMLSGGRPSYEVMVDGTKKRLRTPHWARREGSTKDINANYLEAEFDWLHKALMDIDTARTITWIKESEHNARDETVAAAKEHNRQLIDRALAKDIRERGFQKGEDSETGAPIMSSPLNEEWEGFGQSIAIGLSIVRRQLNAGQVPPELRPAFNALEEGGSSDDVSIFPLLSWIMDNDMPGASGAGMVFKAITSRKAWSRELLGEKWADPMNVGDLVRRGFAPEGSVAWQPDEGRLMFTAKTISEHAMDRMVMMLADEDAGPLDKGEVRRVLESVRPMLAVGGPKYQMVLPAEIAATLNSLRDDYVDSFIEGIVTVPMRWWKRWVLINPRRVVKYNLNNLSGDLDAVIAGNPRVLRRLPQAIKELYAVTYNGAQPSARFQEAVARGVFDSGLTMQEIPDINFMSEFEAITDKPSLARVDKQTLRLLRKTWRFLQRATTFRENWARYAAYLEYADRLEAGESVAKIGYGASLPKMVEALADPQDQAALLARDLVGDYGALSRNGEWLRSHMIPFWSWIEINSKRYWRLVGNAYGQGVGKGIAKTGMVGAVLGARTSVYLGLRMAVLYGLITLWNNLMFPDEEEELDSTQRVRLHLNLGRDRDGVNRTLRIQGAFSDALGWFGFEDAIGMLMEVERGRATYEDVLAAIAKAPVNRIGTSLTPVIQVPLTLATGQKLWPDLFETRRVNDRLREVASTFSMENEYDLLFDKPSRGYLRSWRNSVIYTSEADEQAYYRIRNLVYDWRERERGVSGGSSEGPRTDAYREWKMALRFGDDDAAEDARQRLRDLGASAQDMQTSLRNAAPLGPLAIKDRGAFKRSLTPTERELLERADDWYRETFLSR